VQDRVGRLQFLAPAQTNGTATLVSWDDAEKRITDRLKARREARATR